MKGKEKCKALKEIRKQIAENNNIEYVVSECKHKGECKGTCPKCEAEVRYLEKELEKRRSLGQKVAIAGVSMGIAASMSACSAASVVGASVAGTPATVVYTITHPVVVEPEPLGGEAIPAYPINDPGYDVMGDIEYVPDPEPEPEVLMGEYDEIQVQDPVDNEELGGAAELDPEACPEDESDDGLDDDWDEEYDELSGGAQVDDYDGPSQYPYYLYDNEDQTENE